jgi:hypothetical protein
MHGAKIKALCMGRRWGKTILGGCLALVAASRGLPVAWVAPEYKNTRPLWRFARKAVAPLRASGMARVSEAERQIEIYSSGGFLALYSADNPEAILGEAFGLVIVDEAARIDENVVSEIIMPTLADYDGDLLLISTPRGHNWFYDFYTRGLDDGQYLASWHAPTSANPMPTIQAAYHKAREIVPEQKFKQEWDAEFLSSGTGVFLNIDACATAAPYPAARDGYHYVLGVDLGKRVDYTVVATCCVERQEIVDVVRVRDMEFARQKTYILDACRRFAPLALVVERNNVGDAICEDLRSAGLPVVEFLTTLASKNTLVDLMSLALQNGTIKIPAEKWLTDEFKAFGGRQLPSGLWQYAAAYGHDDGVMACMLALYGAQTTPTWDAFIV